MLGRILLIAALAGVAALPLVAQDDARQQTPDSSSQNNASYADHAGKAPTFRVNVVERTTPAINYRYKGGSTKVDFKGTNLMPKVDGDAKVEGKDGRLAIDADVHHLDRARTFGPEYLTYVLWAITPDGRASNLGEVIPNDDGNAKIKVTSNLQSFGMVITAEPYYAVTHPSDMIVAQNEPTEKTKGSVTPIVARFEASQKGEYTMDLRPQQLPATGADYKKVPLELLQARNAVAIARSEGAEQYAPGAMQKAQDSLSQAEEYYNDKKGSTPIRTASRAATQSAEDARVLSIRKKQEDQAAAERQAERERTQAAQQRAQQEQQSAEQARVEAQQAQAQQQAAQQAADQARQQQLAAQQATEQQAAQQREKLRQQLNQVLQTREMAQGLVANMPDVLFDFNKATLKPAAKERLAKVAGIILAYPDLQLKIDGYTDSVGGEQYNQQLSDERAAAVRDYLISQGVSANNVIAQGFGKNDPIASNATPEGRQQNRRVEMLVSGSAIGSSGPTGTPSGTQSGAIASPSTQQNRTQ